VLVLRALGFGALEAELLVGVADEQGFHLTQKIAGAERFDEQRVRVFSGPIFSVPMFSVPMFSSPMFSGWRIGCE
jgi:hypothetical protein